MLPVRGTQRESWKRSPGKVRSQMFPMFLGFHKWGIPKSWSVYTGKSWKIHENKLDENWGYHHFRKLPSVMMYAQFSSFFYRCRIVFPYIIYIYIHKYLSIYIYIYMRWMHHKGLKLGGRCLVFASGCRYTDAVLIPGFEEVPNGRVED